MDGSSGVANGALAIDYSGGNVTLDRPMILYIGSKGDVKVDTAKGSTVTFKNIPTGSYLRVLVTKIYQTGTTAADIVAVFYAS